MELKKAKIDKEEAEKQLEKERLQEQVEEEGLENDDEADQENDDDDDDEEGDEDEDENDGPQLYDVEEDDLDADLDEHSEEEDESNSSNLNPMKSTSNHLDPSLFKTVFSEKTSQPKSILRSKGSNKSDPSPFEQMQSLQKFKKTKSRNEKKEGKKLARGRDGEGIKRLKDGRTLVRSLNEDKKKPSSSSSNSIVATPLPPKALDPVLSLPNAKARAFKKRSLGLDLKSNSKDLSIEKKLKKVKKTEDDPLGLQDPAFLPGGEFYKGGDANGKRKRGNGGEGLKLGGRRGEGGRKESIARNGFAGNRNGRPAFGFNTSMA